ncbi:MAG TPA: glycosyltransferase family 1 protein [Aquifex aeolicus]|nr:glycosyltransferase family 1 protein [Aquifex aeolicus]
MVKLLPLMEKIKVALLLSGLENFGDFHIIESLKEFLPDDTVELKIFSIDIQNPAKTVGEVEEYHPHFTMDFNTKGIIWAEGDKEKVPLHAVLGTVHLTLVTEDPIYYASNLLNLRNTPNTVFLITDLRFGEFLGSLGFPNIFYFTPCVNFRLIPQKGEKDINLVFVGDALEPSLVVENWKQTMDAPIRDFGIEVGEFCFRNPEITPLYAVEYLLSLMNPQFQESFNKFRKENPQAYFMWLLQVGVYTTARRNWFILSFLEGTELTIVGRVEGDLPEGFAVADISSMEERLNYINRAKLALTAFPSFVPSGIGFTPLEILACETALMINYRHTLPSFFKPGEEIIIYNPLDRMDIEEKLLFYLENEEERNLIVQKGFNAIKAKYSCTDRIQFFKELIRDIFRQVTQQKQGGNESSSEGGEISN